MNNTDCVTQGKISVQRRLGFRRDGIYCASGLVPKGFLLISCRGDVSVVQYIR
jgi:hypothetical protein